MRLIIMILLMTSVYAGDLDRCGDRICNTGENYFNCPTDCDFNPVKKEDYRSICGNGICEKGEDYKICNIDCISPYEIEENRSQNMGRASIVLALLLIFAILVYYLFRAAIRNKVTFKDSLVNLEQRSDQQLQGEQTTFSSLSQNINKEVTKEELIRRMRKSKEYQEMINNGQ